MAVEFHGRQRLLLSKLLNDDDILSEDRRTTQTGSPFGSSSSGLSSPFGSDLCSTETESSDDDNNSDFIAELTRQMADYMLEEDDERLGSKDQHGERIHSTPKLNKPTSIPAFCDDQTRPVHLYKLENQPSIASWGRRVKRTELTHQLEQKQQVHHQKPHHMQSRGRRTDAEGGSGGGFGSPAATAAPPLQQRRRQVGSGSGMRAVFLGGPGSRSGSSGTGVFLPRGTGNPLDVTVSKKKSGCSTVLIPARVMLALQLHFKEMKTQRRGSQSNTCVGFNSPPVQHDVERLERSDLHSEQKGVANHQEIGLPHEWTY
ncbi:uncharacterized protein LOC114273994 isoform X1 [Camellia sinensis]|uniref:Uncharacterized protein n=1 Tax=Camellia sinensis var. sinensis TaxID=542762 RepID=A0A4S4EBV2_CAMSN|nr:uncharacterized protein LOC114273994 isoform X1 [Camellia sinensis]THG13698.1 hypothetical protein TEA_022195 [Camellia sinensis var. sinensis]